MGHSVSHTSGNTTQPDNGTGSKGNPHNVTVEECREMKNAGPITKEQYNQLSDDQKACYKPDGNGGYVVSDDVEAVLAKPEHGGIE